MSLDVALSSARLELLQNGAVLVPVEAAIFRIEGPGAVLCLQGLLTNDLVAPGERSLVYGALLTPKGMVVLDAWVIRLGDSLTLVAEPNAFGPALGIFRKTLPPRLAKVVDLGPTHRAAWALGQGAGAALAGAAGLAFPEPGKAEGTGALQIGAGPAGAPFAALVVGETESMAGLAARFYASGGTTGAAPDIAALRILAGWPTLGREIDDRTIPQEARLDQIGGVSFTKGCYTGQETVVRVHHRGHVNRVLRGAIFPGEAPLAERRAVQDGKEIGVVRSALATGGETLALATLRREVPDGARISVDGREGVVVALPFETRRPR